MSQTQVKPQQLLREVTRDASSVDASGQPKLRLPDGVTFRESTTHLDDRGSVVELYDERWDWHPEPLCFSYCFTIKPGKIKGWGMHKIHQDRYFVLKGEMRVVMYDDRPDASTYQEVSSVVLSEYNRRLMNIPEGIWHANENIGTAEVVVINFPTTPYDHENPDKYRLPLDTDKIPYRFEALRGW